MPRGLGAGAHESRVLAALGIGSPFSASRASSVWVDIAFSRDPQPHPEDRAKLSAWPESVVSTAQRAAPDFWSLSGARRPGGGE